MALTAVLNAEIREFGGLKSAKTEWAACSLDGGGCLSLDGILRSFSAPISEEHAWAVIHQVCRRLYPP